MKTYLTMWSAVIFLALAPLLALANSARKNPELVDPRADARTRALWQNLQTQMGRGILFGHHNSTLQGLGWDQIKGPPAPAGSCDVKKLTGAYPAVYGWDFIEIHGPKLSRAEQRRREDILRQLILAAYRRGGINTISWHMSNPVSNRPYNHCAPDTVKRILPGGDRHQVLIEELDWAADFFRRLKTDNGLSVPIIFRPFHEHTHNGFWWCIPNSSRQDYMALWRFTVKYLRDVKGVHQLLWALSPSGRMIKATQEAYLEVYPGDDWVDILGLDHYLGQPETVEQAVLKGRQIMEKVKIVVQLARKRNKVAAFTECGPGHGLEPCRLKNWYDRCFWQILRGEPTASQIAYLMVWRNASLKRYWIPQTGDGQAEGFLKMYADPYCIFGDRLEDMYRLEPD